MQSMQQSRWLALMLALGIGVGAATWAGMPEGRAHPSRFDAPAESRDRVPGEYIVTASPRAGLDQIHQSFAAFAVESIEGLGPQRFLLRLGHDPGIEAIQRTVQGAAVIERVQPNYRYRGDRPGKEHLGSEGEGRRPR